MERLEYEDYEEFACDIADEYDSLEDEFDDISIIAKYNEAKEIIKELLCLGYDIASIDIHREEFEEYYDEYRIALNQDGVWCQKFKYENGYLNDYAPVCFVMDNCSSAVFKHIDSEEVYEVAVGEDDVDEDVDENSDIAESKHTYIVNGRTVDKDTYKRYVYQFASDLDDEDISDDEKDELDDDDYSITVKCNLDTDEALSIIKDMERRMTRIDDMFHEMDCFKRLLNL